MSLVAACPEMPSSATSATALEKGVMANVQHQRREPAATERRIQTELSDWLPSAECCGSTLFSFPLDFQAAQFREGLSLSMVTKRNQRILTKTSYEEPFSRSSWGN